MTECKKQKSGVRSKNKKLKRKNCELSTENCQLTGGLNRINRLTGKTK